MTTTRLSAAIRDTDNEFRGTGYSEYGMGGSLLSGVGFGSPTLAGPAINDKTALTISAVYNAVNIFANAIASLDFYVAERDDQGGSRRAPEHPVDALLGLAPNDEATSFNFRHTLITHTLCRGNGYAEIVRGRRGMPESVEHLDPANTRPARDDRGRLVYRVRQYNGNEQMDLPAEQRGFT